MTLTIFSGETIHFKHFYLKLQYFVQPIQPLFSLQKFLRPLLGASELIENLELCRIMNIFIFIFWPFLHEEIPIFRFKNLLIGLVQRILFCLYLTHFHQIRL